MNAINNLIVFPDKLDAAIKSLITHHLGCAQYKMMVEGEKYYRAKNPAIMSRKQYVYAEQEGVPVLVEDVYKANNKMPSSFLKIQVDQKVNYSVGQPVKFEADDVEGLEETLGKKWGKSLKKIAKSAAKKSVGWGLVNINAKGEFEVVPIPSEQVIAVYKEMDGESLEYAVRFYETTMLSQKTGEFKTTTQVEVWDAELVTFYRRNVDTDLYELMRFEDAQNPRYHFSADTVYGETTVEKKGLSWGAVPFVPLYNNDEELYDLQPIKAYVDVYDIVQSDFANNLEDFQDVYWILKGYQGTSLTEFLNQVKKYKALKVGEGGDAHAETVEVPYQARQAALQELETAIYKFGMAVDPSSVMGGSLTNVHIRAMFANLDLKASDFEQQVKDFVDKVIPFVNVYRASKGQKPVELWDVVFDRSLIINEVELLTANAGQMGVVSEKTRLSNHPWVASSEDEIAEMQNEGTIKVKDVPPEDEPKDDKGEKVEDGKTDSKEPQNGEQSNSSPEGGAK